MTSLRLRERAALTPEEVGAVLALAEAAARADGAHPLGEHVVMHLQHGRDAGQHLLVDAGRDLVGYAHLDQSDPDGPAAEMALHPDGPTDRAGSLLIEALLDRSAAAGLRLWAHGTRGPTQRLATAHGFGRARRLWQMRRSLSAPLDPPRLPAGVRLRAFDPEADVDAWLALNADAFPHLPDQGRWGRPDLVRRMAQPWFDPAGFLLAEDGAALLGFHWTKVHAHAPGHRPSAEAPRPRDDGSEPHAPIGEVYVLGVAPQARGRGLGRALTLAGLAHLRRHGLTTALLYVDTSNRPAVSLYRSVGFTVWDSDTLLRR